MKIHTSLLLVIMSSVMLAACSTSVERLDAQQQVDLSGAWNDTDSQLVAQEMIEDSLSRAWISKFVSSEGKDPAVIVGRIKNLSHEHINTNTFVANMERELINSGEVQFVASAANRQEIRDERADQDLNASEATRKEAGQEYGADFMMQGQINTIVDVDGTTQVRFYQVNLELISLKDNRKVWIGEKKIKKLISNSKIRP
ncbi:penicillin-binding protein activator LpoB [Psychromonas sp. 14N.309.X.WAT.B.A12]|uniref:penicillin-binding protein activator LpoB n=1 Tax=unclassified Psychromonas TaxID=2614957 RepID=UPI0025B02E74|nr:penicillin-binding protein activator LpoB [Psychromonas sp. 14N.309.X.WAT.B.A12]MDN2661926.1 penicillin-binding protein activator LpoB [Psychromonas sp. 14N.309.X.WAT.B.A12]